MQSMNFANVNSESYRHKFQAILAASPYFGKFGLYKLLKHSRENKRTSNSKRRVLTPTSPADIVRCSFCDYSTGRVSNLRRHAFTMHRSHGGMALTCCNETFPDKGSYRLHARTVHKDGHECQTCHRVFTRKALLRRHQSVHTGVKEFGCHLCSYATSHKSNLERHFKIHVNGRAKSHNPRSKTKNDNRAYTLHRKLTTNWLKKRRAADGGLHPGASTSTALLKARLNRQNQTAKSSSPQSSNWSNSSTSFDEPRLNKPKLTHSIDSILNRPSKSSTQFPDSNEAPLRIKSGEIAAGASRAWSHLQGEDATNGQVEIQDIKKEDPEQQESQLTYFTTSDLNRLYSYFRHMSILSAIPHFQQNNSTVFQNQSQDLRLQLNSYNSSHLLPLPSGFQGVSDAFSPSPQHNYASNGNYLNYSLLAPNNSLPCPLDFSIYQHLFLRFCGIDFLGQPSRQSRPELIVKKEQTEREESPLTCCVNTSAPINTSLTTAFTGGDYSPQPSPITAMHKSASATGKSSRGSSTGTSVTVKNLSQQNLNQTPRKLVKRRNAEVQELFNNTEEEAARVTFTGVENHTVPLKKRRADADGR